MYVNKRGRWIQAGPARHIQWGHYRGSPGNRHGHQVRESATRYLSDGTANSADSSGETRPVGLSACTRSYVARYVLPSAFNNIRIISRRCSFITTYMNHASRNSSERLRIMTVYCKRCSTHQVPLLGWDLMVLHTNSYDIITFTLSNCRYSIFTAVPIDTLCLGRHKYGLPDIVSIIVNYNLLSYGLP